MENQENVLIYLDSSNIFVNAQEYSAKKKRFLRTVRDNNIRIDLGKMVDLARKGRVLMGGRLYGSELPRIDTLWSSIRAQQIEVYPFIRLFPYMEEMRTGPAFSIAATEDIIVLREKAGKDRSIILFNGDLDLLPLVHISLQYGWNVEIWSFKSNLSRSIRNESKFSKSRVKIFYLDDYIDKITFPSLNFGFNAIPAERSFVIKFEKYLCDEERKKYLFETTFAASKLFQMPFKGSFVKKSDPTELILIPSIPEVIQLRGEINDTIYDFNGHIWWRIQELKELIKVSRIVTLPQYLNIKHDYELETRNITDVEENVIDQYDAELTAGEFVTITKKIDKSKPTFSKQCFYDYRCYYGTDCQYNHCQSENEFFQEHPTFKRYKYKSSLCDQGNNCRYLLEMASHKCGFAHSLTEARCLKCHKVGIHWTDECDLN